MSEQVPVSYSDYKDRLDEIVEAVSDEGISLDDALALYEEAVKVGLKLSDRLEADIGEQEAADMVDEADVADIADEAVAGSIADVAADPSGEEAVLTEPSSEAEASDVDE